MIPLFRKVRRQLAYDNRLFQYARYALGEIVLVMVGILLALEVSNWNEARQEVKLELEYLESLARDLTSDLDYFEEKTAYYNGALLAHEQYVAQCFKHQENYSEYRALVDLINLDSENFTAQDITYVELGNAGHLNIFRNPGLKEKIISHYRSYAQAAKHILEFNDYSTKFMARFPVGLGTFYTPVKPPQEEMEKGTRWEWVNLPESEQFLFVLDLATMYGSKFLVFKNYYVSLTGETRALLEEIRLELQAR